MELSQDDEKEITKLLMGRRIVSAEVFKDSISLPGHYGGFDGKLVLDNGKVVYVRANTGCGGCSSGWFELKALAATENIITRVDLEEEDTDNWGGMSYKIFVLAGHERINALIVDGDDGNGWYGTGYELVVVDEKEA